MLAPLLASEALSSTVIAQAIARASAGVPALVVAGGPSAVPLDVASDLLGVGWRTPDGALWIGVGASWNSAVLSDDLAAQVPADLQAVLREGVFGSAEDRAMLRGFGGLAFDPADSRPAPLALTMPAARFWIPEALWHAAPDQPATLRVTVRVQPGDTEPEIRRRWEDAWTRASELCMLAPSAAPRFASEPLTPEAWHAAITAALGHIQAGDVEKVVLARSLVLRADGPQSPWSVWRRLAERAPGTHAFCFSWPEGGAFLGASPERLFALDGRALRLDGLAGTAPRSANEAEDAAFGQALLASDKDRREHEFVVAAIAESLSPLVETLTYAETPVLKRLPTVQHLHTPLVGTLRAEFGLAPVLKALHPTPAVGGTPRPAAMTLIRELESEGRGWYAGPVGWVAADAAEFAVAIRSAYLSEDRAAVMAGAGIVAGSTPDGEWDETTRKAAPLVRLLTEDAQ